MNNTVKKGAPVRVKWDLIDGDWKAGIKSMQTIADAYEEATGKRITPAGIKKHYDELGIPRDLSGKIKAKADELVNKALVNDLVKNDILLTESVVVEENAKNSAAIQIAERKDVSKARDIVMSLFGELEHQVNNKELYEKLGEILEEQNDSKMVELYRKVSSFAGRVGSMKSLSDALKTMIELERRVYKIDADPEGDENKKVNLMFTFK
jgi:hypothetical protein